MPEEKPSFKAVLYIARTFTFSDKRQFLFNFLSFMLPFLLFFPVLFIGLTVQSSFLQEFQQLHPLEQDEDYSLSYMLNGDYSSNTSNIPSDLLAAIDKDIIDIIFYSKLSDYINSHLIFCEAELQYYFQGKFSVLNTLFLQNETFNQLSKYFSLNYIPSTYNNCVMVLKGDLSSMDNYDYSYSIGETISILPFSLETSDVFANNTFVINPLNASVSNIFSINDYLFERRIRTENPFVYRMLSQKLEMIYEYPVVLFSIDKLIDFFQFFPTLLVSEININIQFLYDFSSFQITHLKELYNAAEKLPKLSGISYYHDLYREVYPELADFMLMFRREIQKQWFRLFAIALFTIAFSMSIIWFSTSTNILEISDIYANFMTRGFSRGTILRIFSIARLLEQSLAFLGAFLLSFPLTYLNFGIISLLLKTSFFSLKLISFTAILFPSVLFFIILFTFAVVGQVMLIKKIERVFPNRLSAYSGSSTSPKSQLLLLIVATTFSLIVLSSLLIIKGFLHTQQELTPETDFIINIFMYIFISIVIVCGLFIIINIFLGRLIRISQSLWKKTSKRLAIIFHNLSMTFYHHRKQSFFIALFFLIFLQSFLFPAYLTQHAANSAKFTLGSELTLYLEEPSTTQTFLSEISSFSSVSSAANYTLAQFAIYNIHYDVLVVSERFGSTVVYSKEFHLGTSREIIDELCESTDSILTQSEDSFLNDRIKFESNGSYLTLGINNCSASEEEEQFIKYKFKVLGGFYRFPILLNDYQLSLKDDNERNVPFLVISEEAYKSILKHHDDISISVIEQAVIVKLTKQSELARFLQEVDTLGYSVIPTTWIELYPEFLPAFATSIFALFITSGIFSVVAFIITSVVLAQDMLSTRREKILVLRYRGNSLRKISIDFIFEYLLVLILTFPISCGAAVGTLIFLLKVLVKADRWVLEMAYFNQFSLLVSVAVLVIITITLSIRHLYQKRFLNFQPSIREGT